MRIYFDSGENFSEDKFVIAIRRCGYGEIFDRRSGQKSFVRRLGEGFYPRFHVYLNRDTAMGRFFLNLHLDQKQASYAGHTAHSGEYEDDGVVGGEAERIKKMLVKNLADNKVTSAKKKISWWRKIFG